MGILADLAILYCMLPDSTVLYNQDLHSSLSQIRAIRTRMVNMNEPTLEGRPGNRRSGYDRRLGAEMLAYGRYIFIEEDMPESINQQEGHDRRTHQERRTKGRRTLITIGHTQKRRAHDHG